MKKKLYLCLAFGTSALFFPLSSCYSESRAIYDLAKQTAYSKIDLVQQFISKFSFWLTNQNEPIEAKYCDHLQCVTKDIEIKNYKFDWNDSLYAEEIIKVKHFYSLTRSILDKEELFYDRYFNLIFRKSEQVHFFYNSYRVYKLTTNVLSVTLRDNNKKEWSADISPNLYFYYGVK